MVPTGVVIVNELTIPSKPSPNPSTQTKTAWRRLQFKPDDRRSAVTQSKAPNVPLTERLRRARGRASRKDALGKITFSENRCRRAISG